MYYYPPAVSDFELPRVLRQALAKNEQQDVLDAPLDDALCRFIGCRAAVSGTSWVMMLALLLRHLGEQHEGDEVVLTGYSCNEFTKATLLAGLRPVYVEVNDDLTASLKHTKAAITDDTLAVFAINNAGVESDNRALAELCREAGVACVEDATYTYLGHSDRYAGQPFGSFGDFAVLNFSEGKIIPVGGGAVLLNGGPQYNDVFERVCGEVRERTPASEVNELLDLLVYKAGSSKLGYTAYRHVQAAGGGDLKKRLSMEPTRPGQTATGLARDEQGQITMPPARKRVLRRDARPRPIGAVKQQCGVNVIENIKAYRRDKKATYDALRRGLADRSRVEVLPLPERGVPVRMPVVIDPPLSEKAFTRLERLGASAHYTTAYPMYGSAARPHADRFYETLYTLPTHRYADPAAVLDALETMETMPDVPR